MDNANLTAKSLPLTLLPNLETDEQGPNRNSPPCAFMYLHNASYADEHKLTPIKTCSIPYQRSFMRHDLAFKAIAPIPSLGQQSSVRYTMVDDNSDCFQQEVCCTMNSQEKKPITEFIMRTSTPFNKRQTHQTYVS